MFKGSTYFVCLLVISIFLCFLGLAEAIPISSSPEPDSTMPTRPPPFLTTDVDPDTDDVPLSFIQEPGSRIPNYNASLYSKADLIPDLKIPDTPVHIYLVEGQESRFKLFFLDVKYGYDLVDFEYYKAWCLQRKKRILRNTMHQVRLYACYDPDVPLEFKDMDWNRINYVINHKKGSQTAVQEAIWCFAKNEMKPLSREAEEIIQEAIEKGKDYKPGPGELLAVICFPERQQAMFIEFLLPPTELFAAAPAFSAPDGIIPAAGAPFSPLYGAPLLAVPAILASIPGTPSNSSEILLVPPEIPDTPTPPPVPEASSLLLLGSGLACMYLYKMINKSGTRRNWFDYRYRHK